MTKNSSYGKCNLCGARFNKSALTRHLQSCKSGKGIARKPAGQSHSAKAGALHLVVEGAGLPEYWMHIETPSSARLQDLDRFLRDIWLECCGHLSMFEIGGERYASAAAEEMEAHSMKIQLVEALQPQMKFHYDYDFGTTTRLSLKLVAEREVESPRKSIAILARNDPPPIACGACGKPAAQVCAACAYTPEGWLCNACIPQHKCGDEMLLPAVNSPRVGQCAYAG